MNERRFQVGQELELCGIRFRFVQGKKRSDDVKVEWLTPGGWVAVGMAVPGMLSDFFFENEDVLYPWPAAGGRKYLGYLHDAAKRGWKSAETTLQIERANKQQRLDEAS